MSLVTTAFLAFLMVRVYILLQAFTAHYKDDRRNGAATEFAQGSVLFHGVQPHEVLIPITAQAFIFHCHMYHSQAYH